MNPTGQEMGTKEEKEVTKQAATIAAAANLAATRTSLAAVHERAEASPAAGGLGGIGGTAAAGATPVAGMPSSSSTTSTTIRSGFGQGRGAAGPGELDTDEAAGWTGGAALEKEASLGKQGGLPKTGGPVATPPSTPMGSFEKEEEEATKAALAPEMYYSSIGKPFKSHEGYASETYRTGKPTFGTTASPTISTSAPSVATSAPTISMGTSPMEKEWTGALSPSTTTEESTRDVVGGGAGVRPSSARPSSLPSLSPARALDAINRGLERMSLTTGSLAHKAVETVHSVLPSPAQGAERANLGVEKVEHAVGEAETFAASIIDKATATLRRHLPSPAQGAASANETIEHAGELAAKAEDIAEDMAQHAIARMRAFLPSPAKGAEATNVGIERAQELATEAERVAESMAIKAAQAIRSYMPSPAQGVDTTNAGIEQATQLTQMVSEKMTEKIKSVVPTTSDIASGPPSFVPSPANVLEEVNKGLERVSETIQGAAQQVLPAGTPGGGLASVLPCFVPSPANVLEEVNKGLEEAGEVVQGAAQQVLPAGSPGLGATTTMTTGTTGGGPTSNLPSFVPSPAKTLETVNEGLETVGEKAKEVLPAGLTGEATKTKTRPRGVSFPPSPAQVIDTTNKAIEKGGEAVAAALPSPASEAINRAPKVIGGGAQAQVGQQAPEAGFWEAHEQQQQQMAGLGMGGGTQQEAVSTTKPRSSTGLWGALGNMLEQMHVCPVPTRFFGICLLVPLTYPPTTHSPTHPRTLHRRNSRRA